MRRVAFGFVATAAMVFGAGLLVQATEVDTSPSLNVSPSAPAPGGDYTVEYWNCFVFEGSTVRFEQPESTPPVVEAPCLQLLTPTTEISGTIIGAFMPQRPPLGVASAVFQAPTEPGTYRGTAGPPPDLNTIISLGFEFTIPAPEPAPEPEPAPAAPAPAPAPRLPATGTSSAVPFAAIAAGLLALGVGSLAVGHARRREDLRAP